MTATKRAAIGCALLLSVWLLSALRHRHADVAGRPLLYAHGVVLTMRCETCHREVRSRLLPYADVSLMVDEQGCPVTRTYARRHVERWWGDIVSISKLVVIERDLARRLDAVRDLTVLHG